jgi:hypothetical protein
MVSILTELALEYLMTNKTQQEAISSQQKKGTLQGSPAPTDIRAGLPVH